MTKLFLMLALPGLTWSQISHQASFTPPTLSRIVSPVTAVIELASANPLGDFNSINTMITHAQFNLTTTSTSTTTPSTFTTQIPNTSDPNSGQDDSNPLGQPQPASTQQTPLDPNRGDTPTLPTTNKSKPQLFDPSNPSANISPGDTTDLSILFLSLFIVYVSIIKLCYHNIAIIKRTTTEAGILMIFGIIWELIARQVNSNYEALPRFNSRIFFYLFLPSTVLEAAALLSNKWLFLNLFPILVHSIFGTLLNATSLGFTIYSLNKQNLFSLNYNQPQQPSTAARLYANDCLIPTAIGCDGHSSVDQTYRVFKDDWTLGGAGATFERSYLKTGALMELNNLTLTDCLVFGTILSSIDTTTLLSVFQLNQVNERLYYLVLGEGLMNNAVVLVVLNLLLDFFNTSRLTVVQIYIAIIQFFVTMIGSIFVGLLLASLALLAVRLVKRFQVPNALISYQNQCQTMVETLLILKLAYLTYTLAELAGTSSIVSLATYGILQDQYIKHNLNLRSQLTFRQVILATKTMGVSLVYPLLGMLLVEVTSGSQMFQGWLGSETTSTSEQATSNNANDKTNALINTATILNKLTNRTNEYWNFKFLAFVMIFTVLYRFTWVILLSFFCNLFSSIQRRIKFKEQILVAYGSLKGPLAFAIVHRLVEQGESQYSDRAIRNKHPFIYTILCIMFVSTIFKGSFIRPLVSKVQRSLGNTLSQVNNAKTTPRRRATVFDEINSKVLEYTSHGLNSILGHTKSPYDRFAELNETRIKPYLSRDGSNTNWLSIFYDTLILDETLNHNCFYRSIGHDPTLHSYWHSMTNLTDQRSPNQRWHSGVLDTIDEQGALVRRLPVPIRTRRSFRGSVGPLSIVSSRRSSNHMRIGDIKLVEPNDKSILKELVMFNLKMDESRRRRKASDTAELSGSATGNSLGRVRMLSTTSSGDMAQETSSFELTLRERYQHLMALDNGEDKSGSSQNNGVSRRLNNRVDNHSITTPFSPPVNEISVGASVSISKTQINGSNPSGKQRIRAPSRAKNRGKLSHLQPRYKRQVIREES